MNGALTLILLIFFVLKMLSAFYICCVLYNILQNIVTKEANIINPDQTAPEGVVGFGSI